MSDEPELGIGETHPDSYSVSRNARSRPWEFADATVVDAIGDTVQLVFVTRSRDLSKLEWPMDNSQPTRVALDTVVEEVARLKIPAASANDLALNLLLELSEKFGLNEQALEKNFGIIRDAVRKHRTEEDDVG